MWNLPMKSDLFTHTVHECFGSNPQCCESQEFTAIDQIIALSIRWMCKINNSKAYHGVTLIFDALSCENIALLSGIAEPAQPVFTRETLTFKPLHLELLSGLNELLCALWTGTSLPGDHTFRLTRPVIGDLLTCTQIQLSTAFRTFS